MTTTAAADGPSRALRVVPYLLVTAVGYTLFVVAGLPGRLTAQYDVSLAAFGLLTSLPLGAFVVAQPLAGRLADRYPTTRLLLWAAVVHAILAVGLDLVGAFPALLALRFAWGLVAGLVLSVGATTIARLSGGATGTLSQGIYGGTVTFGGAAGFLLGGPVVAATGGVGLHALGALPAIPVVAICWTNRTERHTAPPGDARPDDGDDAESTPSLATVTNPTVVFASVLYVAVVGSYVTLSTFVTAFFDELGVVGPLNVLVLGCASVGRLAGGLAVWRLPVSDADLAGWSSLAAALGFGTLALGRSEALLVALPLLTMLAVSVPYGAVFDLAAGATDAEGTALATVFAAGNVAALVLPPVSGALREAFGSFAAAFAMLAALNLVALASALALSRNEPPALATQNS